MTVLTLVAAASVSVTGAHITAGDLARALPGFKPPDPSVVVGWAPLPGAVRTIPATELRRMLSPLNSSVVLPAAGICLEVPLAPLSEEAVVEAMRNVLGADSKIEVVEISRFPAPIGEVVFPRESLVSPGSQETAALWRGFVRYGEAGKFQIWARVKVLVPVVRLIAIEPLRQGQPIQASQVKVATLEDAPNSRFTPATVELAQGFIPKRTISANSPVWTDSLDPPMAITKGDRVEVIVRSGLAVLILKAEAMTSGRTGEAISLKNPSSGKLFRARIDGPSAASVHVDPVKQ
jgi:flagella basal body P-ring formation protein FlgA